MIHLVSFDISDAGVRRRVCEVLDDYGVRIHESLFECLWSRDEEARIVERLRVLLSTDEVASLRIYRLRGRSGRPAYDLGRVPEGVPRRWVIW